MAHRSTLQVGYGLVHHSEADESLRSKAHKFWNDPRRKALQTDVAGGSLAMLQRMMALICDWLSPEWTKGDGSCIFHAARAAFKRLGRPWPLGEDVLQDRMVMVDRLDDMLEVMIQVKGSYQAASKDLAELSEALLKPCATLPAEAAYIVLSQM